MVGSWVLLTSVVTTLCEVLKNCIFLSHKYIKSLSLLNIFCSHVFKKFACTAGKNATFPGNMEQNFPSVWQNFPPFLYVFLYFIDQNFPPVAKFPRNEIPSFHTFSRHVCVTLHGKCHYRHLWHACHSADLVLYQYCFTITTFQILNELVQIKLHTCLANMSAACIKSSMGVLVETL